MDYTDVIQRKYNKIHNLQNEIKKIQYEIECLSADPYKMASELKTSQSCPAQLSGLLMKTTTKKMGKMEYK